MEQRIGGLEDQLASALEEISNVRSRELGAMNLMREVIAHMATLEKGKSSFWKQGNKADHDPLQKPLLRPVGNELHHQPLSTFSKCSIQSSLARQLSRDQY